MKKRHKEIRKVAKVHPVKWSKLIAVPDVFDSELPPSTT
jgi:hypothetical protein